MIHILTVHWKSARWIEVQLRFLHEHIKEPFQVYAFLNEVPGDHASKFFYASKEPIREHAIKLNLLADLARLHATVADDLLLFLDGDAFPIGDVVGYGREKLKTNTLVAVQRKENAGDIQPHPCFCLITIENWSALGGDWKMGHAWRNAHGALVSDVGGNLLAALERTGLAWQPMLRSNRKNLHPVCYGIYEDLVYHHGAGFRDPVTRVDQWETDKPQGGWLRFWQYLSRQRLVPRRWARYDPLTERQKENLRLSEQMFERILVNPHFYRELMDAG